MLLKNIIAVSVAVSCLSGPEQARAQGTPSGARTDTDMVLNEARQTVSDDTRTIRVPKLGETLTILPGVFRPILAFNAPLHDYISAQKPDSMKRVLDIASGSGVLGFIALKHGAGEVIATDISFQAVKNAKDNARKLGYSSRYDARLVPEDRPEAFSVIGENERFDLIVLNPPMMDSEVQEVQDRISHDPGFKLQRSFITGAGAHLEKGGRAVVLYLSACVPNALWELVNTLAPASGLKIKVLVERTVPGTPCRLHLVELTHARVD